MSQILPRCGKLFYILPSCGYFMVLGQNLRCWAVFALYSNILYFLLYFYYFTNNINYSIKIIPFSIKIDLVLFSRFII